MKPVALTGGDVHTVTQGVHKGGTVLIKDGKIARVGTGFELPEGTVRIDVTGKRVLPGFVAAQARGLGGRVARGRSRTPRSFSRVDQGGAGGR